jgi:hypothetical protein
MVALLGRLPSLLPEPPPILSGRDRRRSYAFSPQVISHLNQELGEPFRRDAMKKPVTVAGISRGDMRAQQVS